MKIYSESKRFDIALTNKDKVKLSCKDNYITIEFASLDYIDPGSNNFRYKLEGFDAEWILNGNRSYVSYTILPGGTYTFRITGSNNDGVWNEEGAELN